MREITGTDLNREEGQMQEPRTYETIQETQEILTRGSVGEGSFQHRTPQGNTRRNRSKDNNRSRQTGKPNPNHASKLTQVHGTMVAKCDGK
jgi:hypothetical protein